MTWNDAPAALFPALMLIGMVWVLYEEGRSPEESSAPYRALVATWGWVYRATGARALDRWLASRR